MPKKKPAAESKKSTSNATVGPSAERWGEPTALEKAKQEAEEWRARWHKVKVKSVCQLFTDWLYTKSHVELEEAIVQLPRIVGLLRDSVAWDYIYRMPDMRSATIERYRNWALGKIAAGRLPCDEMDNKFFVPFKDFLKEALLENSEDYEYLGETLRLAVGKIPAEQFWPNTVFAADLLDEAEAAGAETTIATPQAAPRTHEGIADNDAPRNRKILPFDGCSCADLRIKLTGNGLRVTLREEPKPGPGVLLKWDKLGCRVKGQGSMKQNPLVRVCADLSQGSSSTVGLPRATLSTKNTRFKDHTGVIDNLWRRSGDTITSRAGWFTGSR